MSDRSEPGRTHPDQQKLATGLLVVLAVIAVGVVLKSAAGIVLPLVVALLLSFVLSPVVELLHRLRVPRLVAILLVILFLLGVGTLAAFAVSSGVRGILRDFPRYQARLMQIVRDVVAVFDLPDTLLTEFAITRQLYPYLLGASGTFFSFVGSLVMVIVFLLFLLLEKPYLRPKVMEALQGPRTEKIWRIVGHTNAQIGRYLTVKLLISGVTGLLTWGAFSLIGIDYPHIWGMLSFLFNFIPSIGSIAISVGSILFALIQFYPEANPVIVAGVSVLTIQLVLGTVIDPKLQGDSLKISPVVILFSLLFWGWLWGVVGLFLAVPLTVALKIVLESIPGYEHFGVLMGRADVRDRAGSG